MADPVVEAAEALYRLPPDEFVAARDERAKKLKATGDVAAAKQVTALRKPTVGAWLVNLLVADDPDLPEQLGELATQLRAASDELAGDDLRALGRQRQELVAGLVHRARQLAHTAGRRTTDSVVTADVESSLRAALADPEVAREVLSGRLLHAVQVSGFGGGADTPPRGPVAVVAPRKKPGTGTAARKAAKESAGDRRRREQRERAETRAREAESSVREAREGRAEAERVAAATEADLTTAEARVAGLRAELAGAEQERESAAAAAHRSRRAVREAAASVRVAEAALRRAQNRLED
jgi:hypothetical protein